jgi:hypothetical protein
MNVTSPGVAIRLGSPRRLGLRSLALIAILAVPVRDASARIYQGSFINFPVSGSAAVGGSPMAQRPAYAPMVLEAATNRAAADPLHDHQVIRYAGTERPPPPAPSIRVEDIVGRWGYAGYRREEDRARVEEQAKGACRVAYMISDSPSGGVMMHRVDLAYMISRSLGGGVRMLGHDSPYIRDMNIKGSVEGKTYIGPGPDPASADDREVVSFDGRVLIMRWVDPEVAWRYGFLILGHSEQ